MESTVLYSIWNMFPNIRGSEKRSICFIIEPLVISLAVELFAPGMMDKPVRHKFEDAEFPVPERAVECLAMQYGDDWNVVPEGSGRQTHAFRVDYEISANNYYRLIDKSIDWDKAYDALNIRKQNRIRLYDILKGLDEFRQKLSSGSIK